MGLGFGPGELVILLVIALVVFGPGKLPQIGGAVGKSVRDFRKATGEVTREFNESVDAVKQPIEQIKRMPSDLMSGAAAGTPAPATACPQCSEPNPPGLKFCGHCGAQLV